MEFVMIWIVFLIIVIIADVYYKRQAKKSLVVMLKNNWGNVPEEEYTSEKLFSLKQYYNSLKDPSKDVDDITWNDLDMNQVFMMINNTSSAIGEEYLYSMLHKSEFNKKPLLEKSRLIAFFGKDEEARLKLQMELVGMGKLKSLSIYEYINRTDQIKSGSSMSHILMAASLVLALVVSPFIPSVGVPAAIIFLGNNVFQYYRRKAQVESYFTVFSYISRLLSSVDKINSFQIGEIEEYAKRLVDLKKPFKKFLRGSTLVIGGNSMKGNFADIILDYIRMAFHIDLIKFESMLRIVRENRKELNEIFGIIGYLDSMIAIASFRDMMKDYCEPELVKGCKPFVELKETYHLMLDEPVVNSIKEEKSVLITGSNASGKSTFIKTIAINAILAQTIYTCLCKQYRGSYFKIYSSMALQDDIFNHESYYIVEIKSIKRILNQIEDDIPVLCFVDEVLRGTNTLERIAASSQILRSLANTNALCFAATHDLELTHMLEKYFNNYHFRELVKDNDILFDYTLHKGRAVSKNAIKLLGIMGYPKEIIEEATNTATEFLNSGHWSAVK